MVASWKGLPVSTTQSIMGGMKFAFDASSIRGYSSQIHLFVHCLLLCQEFILWITLICLHWLGIVGFGIVEMNSFPGHTSKEVVNFSAVFNIVLSWILSPLLGIHLFIHFCFLLVVTLLKVLQYPFSCCIQSNGALPFLQQQLTTTWNKKWTK